MSVVTTRSATLSILELEAPGRETVAAGVLLLDLSADRLYIRLRRDWDTVVPDQAEVLELIESDLSAKAAEMGGSSLLVYLEDTLSNLLRIGDRHEIAAEDDFERAVSRLYRQNVRATVRQFVTHVPRYSLAVAAGKFLENAEVSEEGWEETPPDLKVTPQMFAARIEGHSMEPLIPHGSLCVFRAGVSGSRQGRLVLVEALGRGANDRYTVKRYRSEKSPDREGGWEHSRILLEPLNPEFEAWALDPGEAENLRVIAEFVRVIN